jgi:predicted HNH restriction endonuclease
MTKSKIDKFDSSENHGIESWKVDILKLSKKDWLDLLGDSSIFNPRDLSIIYFVYDCEYHRSTAYDIAERYGVHWNAVTAWNRALAKRILTRLGAIPQPNDQNGSRFWNIVYTGNEFSVNDKKGHFRWVLRPNLAAAIGELVPYEIPDEQFDTDFSDQAFENRKSGEPTLLQEGRVQSRVSITYERHPQSRKICIEKNGTRCVVCGFDSKEKYDTINKNIIEVHHIMPISDFNGETHHIDPAKDLQPVCPNCHRAIHTKNPPYSIAELCALLK